MPQPSSSQHAGCPRVQLILSCVVHPANKIAASCCTTITLKLLEIDPLPRTSACLPAKDNVKFHGLLLAAIASVSGHPAKEPNWESLTKTAVERSRKNAASGS
jgi:hypothetical protein